MLLICLHFVKWFQVFLCITSNSIKHKSFVYTQLNGPTVLFDPFIGLYQVLSQWVRVDLGAMEMKRRCIFPKALRLEPHHQIVKCHIQDTLWGSIIPLQRCIQCILQLKLTGLPREGRKYYWTLAWWLECSPMAWETRVQSQVESYRRLKK